MMIYVNCSLSCALFKSFKAFHCSKNIGHADKFYTSAGVLFVCPIFTISTPCRRKHENKKKRRQKRGKKQVAIGQEA